MPMLHQTSLNPEKIEYMSDAVGLFNGSSPGFAHDVANLSHCARLYISEHASFRVF